jgi:DNA polymerase elongation subunit (family B)
VDPHANKSPIHADSHTTSFYFTKRKEGIIPRIERELVARRKAVRKKLEQETDPDKKKMYDAEQLELKITANSMYGLLGTPTSEVSHLSGAYSVTAWGKQGIKFVEGKIIETYPDELEIIYGDTDSLFVHAKNVTTLEEAQALAKHTETWVNELMNEWLLKTYGIAHGVLKMEAENISHPFLLNDKKKYIKYIYPVKWPEDPDEAAKYPKMKKSGIDTRASTKYTKQVMDEVAKAVMVKNRPAEEVNAMIRERLSVLYMGELQDKTLLKKSANISKPVKDYPLDLAHIVAAKQLLADDLPIEPGDRVEYYYGQVCSSTGKTADYVVSAHLIDKYDLHWDMYVEEIVTTLENTVERLLDTPVRFLADPKTYKKRKAMQLRQAPKRTNTYMDKLVQKQPRVVPSEKKEEREYHTTPGFKQMTVFGQVQAAPAGGGAAAADKRKKKKAAVRKKKPVKGGTTMNPDVAKSFFSRGGVTTSFM